MQTRPPKHWPARNALTSRYMGAVPITLWEPSEFRGFDRARDAGQVLPQDEHVEKVLDWRGFGRRRRRQVARRGVVGSVPKGRGLLRRV